MTEKIRTQPTRETSVQLPLREVTLDGTLTLPENPQGVILFAHGSGSSRFSPRNHFVAQALNRGRFGTLLFDLLTAEEDQVDQRTRELRFDIELLARRVIGAVDWVYRHPDTQGLPIGLFGASTGAAAALVTAAFRPAEVCAVVSRGGRPDLAGADTLEQVLVPTLLIVGGDDQPVIELNEQAMRHMRAETRLEIVPGATHLFEESGALEEVARLARGWFEEHLVS